MKFLEAMEKLKGITKGNYCSLQYTMTVHTDGQEVPQCSLYTEKTSWTYPPTLTWGEAFKLLDEKIIGIKSGAFEEAPE